MPSIRTLPLAAMAAAMLLLAPTPAMAHPGHGLEVSGGLMAGFLHPLTGLDHLASLVLAGVWAAVLGGRALVRLPAALLAGMVAGFVLAPAVGSTIAEGLAAAATVALIGVAALRIKAPLPVASAACAVFGFGHGLAHGLEVAGSAPAFASPARALSQE